LVEIGDGRDLSFAELPLDADWGVGRGGTMGMGGEGVDAVGDRGRRGRGEEAVGVLGVVGDVEGCAGRDELCGDVEGEAGCFEVRLHVLYTKFASLI
jgi:hypothetical protein